MKGKKLENKVNKEDAVKFLKETGYEFDSYIMAVVEKMLFNFAEQQVKSACDKSNVMNTFTADDMLGFAEHCRLENKPCTYDELCKWTQ